MNTKYKTHLLILALLACFNFVSADGLILSSHENYPTTVLKNKSTTISVAINGNIAETIVTQEFENEWYKTTDGVYSFPLPIDARATRLMYSQGDSLVDAFLKEKQQSTNPGTGEGGETSHINKYMGKNVIRLEQVDILPHDTRTIVLHYIQTLNQYNHQYIYQYPFNTENFIESPIDFLKLSIQVKSKNSITDYNLNMNGNSTEITNTENEINLLYSQSKVYTAKDILFTYNTEKQDFNIDLQSSKTDSTDGYFCLTTHPPLSTTDEVFTQHIVFALNNSSTMIGTKLDQSKVALSMCFEKLKPTDFFNVVLINSRTEKWQSQLVQATQENINSAKEFIKEIRGEHGNNMQDGLTTSFKQFDENSNNSNASILVFSDGRGLIDPFEVEKKNTNQVGIFFVAIGKDVDQARLETTANLNYGFVSYMDENTVLASEMASIFERISNPLVKNTKIEYIGGSTHSVLPQKTPTFFAGSDFIQTGLYKEPGDVTIKISGESPSADFKSEIQSSFSQANDKDFCRKLWVKQVMDEMEAQILIDNELDSLKKDLVALSLLHNIKCRYTAFTIEEDIIKDPDEPVYTDDDEMWVMTKVYEINKNHTRIISGYPNPFINQGTIKIYISSADIDKVMSIKVYDFCGRIVEIINLSDLSEGTHEISLTGKNILNKGVYIIVLEAAGQNKDKMKLICN